MPPMGASPTYAIETAHARAVRASTALPSESAPASAVGASPANEIGTAPARDIGASNTENVESAPAQATEASTANAVETATPPRKSHWSLHYHSDQNKPIPAIKIKQVKTKSNQIPRVSGAFTPKPSRQPPQEP